MLSPQIISAVRLKAVSVRKVSASLRFSGSADGTKNITAAKTTAAAKHNNEVLIVF